MARFISTYFGRSYISRERERSAKAPISWKDFLQFGFFLKKCLAINRWYRRIDGSNTVISLFFISNWISIFHTRTMQTLNNLSMDWEIDDRSIAKFPCSDKFQAITFYFIFIFIAGEPLNYCISSTLTAIKQVIPINASILSCDCLDC